MPTTAPRLPGLDSSVAFLSDGYLFGLRRFEQLQTDVFRTRVAGRPVTVMYGEEAARIFYEDDRFTRERAMPASVMHLLQDEGSVQSLSDLEHDARKRMFMHALIGPSVERIGRVFAEEWHEGVARWSRRESVVLHTELLEVLTRTACRWAGVPLQESEVGERASELGAMIEHAGSFGPPNWGARARRLRSEEWARSVIRRARAGWIPVEPGTALAELVDHTDADGSLLDDRTAAVELLNILRPIVAVGRFITFAALALRVQPAWQRRFAEGDDAELAFFVDEVRRYYPFFPVIAGTAAFRFDGLGQRFEPRDWVMLDLYATNHDARIWDEPFTFAPERFRGWDGNRNTLVPQGAGLVESGHRCPGEPITLELMATAVRELSRGMSYELPEQDFRVSLRRFPAIPESGMRLAHVRPSAA
jgi:fatty-acid peroxygenase